MRKPRDYDAELKLLDDKARALRARKLEQLGELVLATCADTLPVEQLAGTLLMATELKDAAAVEAQHTRGAAFFRQRVALAAPQVAMAADRRAMAARHRLRLQQARHDTRDWQVKRRERTRQLIELGGLVAKAGLVELTDDDRAIIYGALLDEAAKLRRDEAGSNDCCGSGAGLPTTRHHLEHR